MSDAQPAENENTPDQETNNQSGTNGPLVDADTVIEAFGGIRPMATQLDIAVSTVQGWKNRNHIPDSRWRDIVAAADAHGIDLATLTQAAPDTTAKVEDAGASSDGEDKAQSGAEIKTEEAVSSPAPPKTGGGAGTVAAIIALVAVAGLVSEPYWRPAFQAKVEPLIAPYITLPATESAGDPQNTAPIDMAEVEAMTQRLADLTSKVERLAGQAQSTLADINATDGAAGLLPNEALDQIDTLESRLSSLEEAEGASIATEALVQEATLDQRLSEMMAALEARLTSLSERIDRQQVTLDDRLDDIATAPALIGAKRVATMVSLATLQDAAIKGRPYESPLQRVNQLLVGEALTPQSTEALAILDEHAESGVATIADLIRRFNQNANVINASLPENIAADEAGWVRETLARLSRLVSVRAVGEDASAPPVSQAEAALSRGDLVGAVASLSALRNTSKEAAQWLDAAEARLQVESAIDQLRAATSARVSAQAIPSQGPQPQTQTQTQAQAQAQAPTTKTTEETAPTPAPPTPAPPTPAPKVKPPAVPSSADNEPTTAKGETSQ